MAFENTRMSFLSVEVFKQSPGGNLAIGKASREFGGWSGQAVGRRPSDWDSTGDRLWAASASRPLHVVIRHSTDYSRKPILSLPWL
jgi:hypothetical protein